VDAPGAECDGGLLVALLEATARRPAATIADVRAAARRALATLRTAAATTGTSARWPPSALRAVATAGVEVLAALAALEARAGHTARAASLLAANFEYNVRCPPALARATPAARAAWFGTYWDGGGRRIGDAGTWLPPGEETYDSAVRGSGWAAWLDDAVAGASSAEVRAGGLLPALPALPPPPPATRAALARTYAAQAALLASAPPHLYDPESSLAPTPIAGGDAEVARWATTAAAVARAMPALAPTPGTATVPRRAAWAAPVPLPFSELQPYLWDMGALGCYDDGPRISLSLALLARLGCRRVYPVAATVSTRTQRLLAGVCEGVVTEGATPLPQPLFTFDAAALAAPTRRAALLHAAHVAAAALPTTGVFRVAALELAATAAVTTSDPPAAILPLARASLAAAGAAAHPCEWLLAAQLMPLPSPSAATLAGVLAGVAASPSLAVRRAAPRIAWTLTSRLFGTPHLSDALAVVARELVGEGAAAAVPALRQAVGAATRAAGEEVDAGVEDRGGALLEWAWRPTPTRPIGSLAGDGEVADNASGVDVPSLAYLVLLLAAATGAATSDPVAAAEAASQVAAKGVALLTTCAHRVVTGTGSEADEVLVTPPWRAAPGAWERSGPRGDGVAGSPATLRAEVLAGTAQYVGGGGGASFEGWSAVHTALGLDTGAASLSTASSAGSAASATTVVHFLLAGAEAIVDGMLHLLAPSDGARHRWLEIGLGLLPAHPRWLAAAVQEKDPRLATLVQLCGTVGASAQLPLPVTVMVTIAPPPPALPLVLAALRTPAGRHLDPLWQWAVRLHCAGRQRAAATRCAIAALDACPLSAAAWMEVLLQAAALGLPPPQLLRFLRHAVRDRGVHLPGLTLQRAASQLN